MRKEKDQILHWSNQKEDILQKQSTRDLHVRRKFVRQEVFESSKGRISIYPVTSNPSSKKQEGGERIANKGKIIIVVVSGGERAVNPARGVGSISLPWRNPKQENNFISTYLAQLSSKSENNYTYLIRGLHPGHGKPEKRTGL